MPRKSSKVVPAPAKKGGKKKKKKGGKKKKTQRKSRASPLPDDPWAEHRSQFGGKMSPNEEWERCVQMLDCIPASDAGARARVAVAIEDAEKEAEQRSGSRSRSPGRSKSPGGRSRSPSDRSKSPSRISPSPSPIKSPPPSGASAEVTALTMLEGGSSEGGAAVEGADDPIMVENKLAAEVARERLAMSNIALSTYALSTATRAQIVILDLDDNVLTATAVETAFSAPYGSAWLRSLSLRANKLERVPHLSGLPKLLRLRLDANPLRSLDGALAAFAHSPQLRSLSLARCPLASLLDTADAVVAQRGGGGAFALADLPHLQELDLGRVFPAAALMTAIEPLRTLRRLTSINLAPAEPLRIRTTADAAAEEADAERSAAVQTEADEARRAANAVLAAEAAGQAALAAVEAEATGDPLVAPSPLLIGREVEVEVEIGDGATSADAAYAAAATYLSQKLSCLQLMDGMPISVVLVKPAETLQQVRCEVLVVESK